MNINQIAFEMYGKYYADLNPYQQDAVWAKYESLQQKNKQHGDN